MLALFAWARRLLDPVIRLADDSACPYRHEGCEPGHWCKDCVGDSFAI